MERETINILGLWPFKRTPVRADTDWAVEVFASIFGKMEDNFLRKPFSFLRNELQTPPPTVSGSGFLIWAGLMEGATVQETSIQFGKWKGQNLGKNELVKLVFRKWNKIKLLIWVGKIFQIMERECCAFYMDLKSLIRQHFCIKTSRYKYKGEAWIWIWWAEGPILLLHVLMALTSWCHLLYISWIIISGWSCIHCEAGPGTCVCNSS